MLRLLLVALGGSIGSVARYLLAGAVQRFVDVGVPVGTLSVNLVGSFLIGLVMALALQRGTPGPETRIFLTAGFCGGFTDAVK